MTTAALQRKFITSLRGFIIVHDGDVSQCTDTADYILLASYIADKKGIEPPCLDFRRFYSDEIYKLQTNANKNQPQQDNVIHLSF